MRDASRTRSGVSPWWRIAAVILVVLLAVLALSVTVFEPPASKILTKVEWSSYEVSAGPGDTNNVTTIRGMCAPADAVTVGIFSMVWATSTGKAVQQVRIWTVYPPNPAVVALYLAVNSSSGGTSFLSLYPEPCSLPWNLDVESNQTVTVAALATLTYNYTAPTPTL
ncbi:MAG: hypothetical protein WB873_02680 [Thermoplasmata archaeon]